MLIQIVAGALLITHGLVHLLSITSGDPEFSSDGSWLVPDAETVRWVCPIQP